MDKLMNEWRELNRKLDAERKPWSPLVPDDNELGEAYGLFARTKPDFVKTVVLKK